ncbi:hypothetical protein DSO57_1019986 [Entomophthora muscae]|uniref:Uncharacterized protein n=1 Tax=Entomophthora muscae TaxID=34485 RepID=A0ACC2U1M6_9FUNG|nr:hypothetical protein DSO57_1019986 [Entomophthora muscae]
MFRHLAYFPAKPGCAKLFWRGYAAPQTKQTKANKGNMSIGGDSRNEIIRRSLFDAPLRQVPEPTEVELEQDRVIQMAWDLYVKEKRDAHVNQGIVKYLRMVRCLQ